MDLHRLEVFCRVVELKSFTKAAEASFLSQPTVSEHLRTLEEILAVKLVDRLGREVLPTPAGKILYDYARRILRLRNEAVEAIANHSGRYAGHLWVAAGTIPGTYLLPELIGRFKESYPEVLVTVKIANSRQAAELVVQGDCEFGVVGARWNEAVLEWEPLFADELSLVVRHDHPWAGRGEIEPVELAEPPFIDRERESGTRKVMHEILQRHGLEVDKLRVIAEMGSTEAVCQSVKAGIGVAILSRQAIRDDLACGSLAEVAIRGVNFTRPFYLVRRRKRQPSPIAALFLDFLKSNSGG
ncbi:MAG TPA: LysR family transcriptional regulator [Desulfurivibrio alkaliphilus]|uniref:LysR family transcriptional regulator n=1 Tax=Desulfurivibrio alkaliphilus TaxID=427923 RepID=A0A7C2TK95_9BACT|nr:LysR family transcriptional regulator [Desulfurivibrio alkaliphilus]